MRLVVQRVARASVRAEGELVGAIGPGMLVLLCAMAGDGPAEAELLAERLAHYRFFADPDGRMNLSALDVRADCLVVSQFTLAADGGKGRRPSFDRAAERGLAESLCRRFAARLAELGLSTASGRFGASMQVELINDGPVTLLLECPPRSVSAGGETSCE